MLFSNRDESAHRPRRRLFGISAVAAAAALTLTAFGSTAANADSLSSTAKSLPTITYGTVAPSANGINLEIAIDRGTFKKNGLNVQLKLLSNSTTVLTDLGKGYQMSSGFVPSLVDAYNANLKLKVVGGDSYCDTSHPCSGVILPKGSTVKNLKDLAGKTIGCVGLTNDLWTAFLNELKLKGVDTSSIHGVIVPAAAQQAELQSGKIAAAVATYPFISQMTKAGMTNLGDPLPAVGGGKVAGITFVTTPTYASSHEALLKKFRTALDQTNAWMAKNPKKIPALLAKITDVPLAAAKETKLAGFDTSFTKAQYTAWLKAIKRTTPGFSTGLTYSKLAASGIGG